MIKYAEIAIKGKNRYLFEDALVKQMKLALEPVEGEFTVTKEQGRVYVFCPEKYDFDEAVEALQRVFGIVGISPVVIYEDQGFEQMAQDVVAYMEARYPGYAGSFKVYTRRAKKSYPISFQWKSAQGSERKSWDAFPQAFCRCASSGDDLIRRDSRQDLCIFRNYSGSGRNADRNKRKGHASSFRRY